MRSFFAVFAVLFAGLAVQASAQSACTTGLCLQQVSCPDDGTTSITGTVYAPNGIDPLPNVLVYIPNDTVTAFTPGVDCPAVGAPPSGSPIVGAITAVDGTFKLTNVPVGSSIPLVIQTGRWRRQVVVPTTTACTDTAFSTRMPKNHSEGDIPRIAIATGSADQVECVLLKVGIDQAEFTDPSGPGRINFYPSDGSAGAQIGTGTPALTESDLMGGTGAALNAYDVLMLPCEGGVNAGSKTSDEYSNLISFANAGGRVYASHYSYQWMYSNTPFSGVAKWHVGEKSSISPDPGVATVDTSFSEGDTLAQWLQLPAIGATTTQGQMTISTLRQDTDGVNAPTQSWLTLNNTGKPVMQFVFDTPIGATNQCGRVLFNEYHVENLSKSTGLVFPHECSTSTTMSPQEKLLEFSLFELTANGNPATLAPTTADFGSEPISFTTAAQTFTWTNNSVFGSSVTLLKTTGDFSASASNCVSVAAGASCQIRVVFSPTDLGARTGTLIVGSSGTTLTATLTGTGTPGLTVSPASLTFGSVDIGGSATLPITLTNNAPGGLALPAFSFTGDYSATTDCSSTIPAFSSCTIHVIFSPTSTGARSGSLAVGTSIGSPSATMTGNGIDFSIAIKPESGTVIAGYGITTVATLTPIAGFAAPLSLSCTTSALASTCTVATPIATAPADVPVNITTTSRYSVIGFGGLGGGGLLWLFGAGSGLLLWMRRRNASAFVWGGMVVVLLSVAVLSFAGCSGKQPSQNASYTEPGDNTYTVTATDGTITHSVTYTLHVTAK